MVSPTPKALRYQLTAHERQLCHEALLNDRHERRIRRDEQKDTKKAAKKKAAKHTTPAMEIPQSKQRRPPPLTRALVARRLLMRRRRHRLVVRRRKTRRLRKLAQRLRPRLRWLRNQMLLGAPQQAPVRGTENAIRRPRPNRVAVLFCKIMKKMVDR
ncbi:hypothetical protein L917_21499 [Phytophthora nicotianae]|uniref:Uncharacterized protein n=1 Tax=Phytophthora nicotianae TaxID=4792 RepID=W2JZ17_PHYNI|nr:hypothetical protein L917_21499 [Phytophthora nicotianae]